VRLAQTLWLPKQTKRAGKPSEKTLGWWTTDGKARDIASHDARICRQEASKIKTHAENSVGSQGGINYARETISGDIAMVCERIQAWTWTTNISGAWCSL
jgi:hypothetical protein